MERPLTKREQAMIEYHRSMLKSGGLKNDDGSITTFRGERFDSPDGNAANKKYPYARVGIAPSYVNGQVLDTRTPKGRELMNQHLKNIKYPTYKTDIEADMAEDRMHDIMIKDLKSVKKQQSKPMSQLLGIKK